METKNKSNLQFYRHVRTFIRNKEYIFTFCGVLIKNQFQIGISACNLTTEKNWYRKKGNEFARKRAISAPSITKTIFEEVSNRELNERFHFYIESFVLNNTPKQVVSSLKSLDDFTLNYKITNIIY